MVDVRVQLKIAGIRKLLRSAEVQRKVDDVGSSIADAAARRAPQVAEDIEYTRGKPSHKWTNRGYVQLGSARARRAQAREAFLEGALTDAREA